MGAWTLIVSWWRAKQRKLDLEILWPQLCIAADNIESAKQAFVYHMLHDRAWLALDEEAFSAAIRNLKPPDPKAPK